MKSMTINEFDRIVYEHLLISKVRRSISSPRKKAISSSSQGVEDDSVAGWEYVTLIFMLLFILFLVSEIIKYIAFRTVMSQVSLG